MRDVTITPDENIYLAKDTDAPDDWHSETTSIASNFYQGLIENGRRYQTLRESGSHVPADDKMFQTYEIGHLVLVTLDSHLKNPLFQAPVQNPKNILDIGTGKGNWAIDVADMFPETTVRGVDLFPPPETWIPPNCILEVDDILQDWTWRDPFDLIHLRILDCAFTSEETDRVYELCYNHSSPGGWIEQVELSAFVECDDNSMAENSILRSWGPNQNMASETAGRRFGIMHTMQESMEKAGYTDFHVKDYKLPIGPWPRDKQLKEAGYGHPAPWSMEEVLVYLAELRKEIINPRNHCYHRARRIWARKPYHSTEPYIKPEPST